MAANKKQTKQSGKKPADKDRAERKQAEEQAFFDELGKETASLLNSFAFEANRLGCGSYDIQNDRGINFICVFITRGLASMLPCVPDSVRAECARLYVEDMARCKEAYGEDFKSWPDEAYLLLTNDCHFIMSVFPKRVRKASAEFQMGIEIHLPGWSARIRKPAEMATGLIGLPFEIMDWPRKKEELREHVFEYLQDWILSPDCWPTSRDRRIELFCDIFSDELQFLFPISANSTFPLPRKFWACIIWLPGSAAVSRLGNADLRAKCESIVGGFFNPGKCAAFTLAISLETPGDGAAAFLRGPFPYNPLEFLSAPALIEKGELIYETKIAEESLSARVGLDTLKNSGQPPVSAAAESLVHKVMELLGVQPEESA